MRTHRESGATWWQRLVFIPATAFDLALTRVLVLAVTPVGPSVAALSALGSGVLASLVVLTARPIGPAGARTDVADVTTAQEPIASHTPNQ